MMAVALCAGVVAVSPWAVGAEGPIAHWKFAGDTEDASGNRLRAVNHGGSLDAAGPDGQPRGAIRLDGRDDYLEVRGATALDGIGTGDFSIALWVDVAKSEDDVPGDLVSKYDASARTGFRLGIDSRAGVTSSQSNWRNLHFGIDHGRDGEWTDHGRLGDAVLIYAMAVHDGQLFVGTCEPEVDGAGHVFGFDGETWTDRGAPNRANAISSLAVYKGRLYAAASKYRLRGSGLTESDNPNIGGTVYRYEGDGHWTDCGKLPEVEAIGGLVVYRGRLYAGSMYAPAGFFRYEGDRNWTPCGTPDGKRVESLTVYNGHVYASGYDEGAVYRYDGADWTRVGLLPGANQTYGFAVHHGDLYVSEWPHALVYRFAGGTNWVSAGRLGAEKESMPLVVYNGKMYGGTLPLAEVYRYDGALDWTKIGRLDHTPDVVYRRVWSMAVFEGRLFAGVLPSGKVHSIEIGKNATYDKPLPNGWRHVTAVREADRLKLYVDGKPVANSTPFDARRFDLSNDEPLRIGFGSVDHFHGRLSDLRIYDRAITPEEIAKIRAFGAK